MKLFCPSCKNAIAAADIDLAGRTAKCGSCNEVFNFSGQLSAGPSGDAGRVAVGKPGNFDIVRGPDGLRILRRWFSPGVLFLTFFCLFWNGFMAVWFVTAVVNKAYQMALFGSLHGAVGLGLLYAVLAGYLNKTTIHISFNRVCVSHAPIPWFGNRNFSKQDIKQLYTKEETHYSKGGHSHTYSVHAVTVKGETVPVVSGLVSSEGALFIEQEMEKYMNIEDIPVRGEIAR